MKLYCDRRSFFLSIPENYSMIYDTVTFFDTQTTRRNDHEPENRKSD